jgi:tRNA pseudouridine38-40 synthase
MTRWKLTIEYDGGGFCGWQRQATEPSVQQTIEEAIQKFSDETVTIHGSGRTDSGVHAKAQAAHFDLEKITTPEVIRDALNFYIRPQRAVILGVEQVADDFHARFSAKNRSYRYQIINRRPPLALDADHAWHIIKPLDIKPMQQAADLLIGTHDFSTFRAKDCQSKSPVKTLEKLDVTQTGDSIFIDTTARSYLYHQVRNMVGTLMMVGTGQWSQDDFRAAFAAKDRAKGGPTAPPQGLFFWQVKY